MKTDTAKAIALKIERDFQKFFKVKYEFKNAVEKAMIEYAKAKVKEQRKLCQDMYEQDKEIAGNDFYCDSRYFINTPTPDFK